MNGTSRLFSTLLLLLVVSIAAAGCTSESPDPAPLQSPVATALAEATHSASGTADETSSEAKPHGPLLNLYRLPVGTFEELVRQRPNVVIATVVRQADDHWPASGGAQTLVASRFVLRIESVLSGELEPGLELTLQTPGGTTKTDGVPATGGSARPEPGDETTVVEYADWPMFDVGSTELIFLYKGTTESGERSWGAVPEGRYLLRDGTFETIFPGDPPQNVVLARDITSRIVGKTLAQVQAEVDAVGP